MSGCALLDEEGPLFNGIQKVVVSKVGSAGLTRKEVGPDLMPRVNKCLTNGTTEIPADKASTDLLASTFVVEVSDTKGTYSFELYTQKNLKGNRGKYYENLCLYDLITKLGL
jgi:hypothetical protein